MEAGVPPRVETFQREARMAHTSRWNSATSTHAHGGRRLLYRVTYAYDSSTSGAVRRSVSIGCPASLSSSSDRRILVRNVTDFAYRRYKSSTASTTRRPMTSRRNKSKLPSAPFAPA